MLLELNSWMEKTMGMDVLLVSTGFMSMMLEEERSC